MEQLALIVIALCGFLSGCSAHINPYSVPQREPSYFWLIIATLVSAITIWGGIEGVCWFIGKVVGLLLLAAVMGASLSWLLRKESPMIED